jgi:hypothetical protein
MSEKNDAWLGIFFVMLPLLFIWYQRESNLRQQVTDLQSQIQQQRIYQDAFEKGVLSK